MADKHLNDKLNFISKLAAFSKSILALRGESFVLGKQWSENYFQDGAPYDFTADDLANSEFEGLAEQEVEDTIGSLELFDAFMNTHAVNFTKVAN